MNPAYEYISVHVWTVLKDSASPSASLFSEILMQVRDYAVASEKSLYVGN